MPSKFLQENTHLYFECNKTSLVWLKIFSENPVWVRLFAVELSFEDISKKFLQVFEIADAFFGNPLPASLVLIDATSKTLFRNLHVFYQAKQFAFIFNRRAGILFAFWRVRTHFSQVVLKMKNPSRWFVALGVLLIAASSVPMESAIAGTGSSYRLSRPGAPTATSASGQSDDVSDDTSKRPAFDRSRPLEGKVEQQDGSDLIDVNQFKGSAAQMDGNRPPRSAGINTTGLRGGTGQNQLQGGANTNGLRGGVGNDNLGAGVPGYGQRPPFNLGAPKTHLQGDVSDKDMKSISNYDVVVMQDRSSSMGDHENILLRNGAGMRRMTRWDWCLFEAADFTRQTSFLPNWAFTLVLFSNEYDVFHRVALSQLPQIYNRSGIYIGTKLAAPMAEQISMYFRRRQMGEKRPLLIAVITDGKPQDDENLRDLLVQTTHQMRNPNEVKIVFLQVGTSEEGSEKLFKLDRKLQTKGAKFDIVSVKPFYELSNVGLTRALVDTIRGGTNTPPAISAN